MEKHIAVVKGVSLYDLAVGIVRATTRMHKSLQQSGQLDPMTSHMKLVLLDIGQRRSVTCGEIFEDGEHHELEVIRNDSGSTHCTLLNKISRSG